MTTKPTKIEELIAAGDEAKRSGTRQNPVTQADVKFSVIATEAIPEIKEMYEENKRLREFVGLETAFDVDSPEQNAARYDGYLDGVQVGLAFADEQKAQQITKLREALIDIKTCGSGTIARKIAIQTLAETKEDE